MKKLEKGTYIIGVSGGPDSMALLDMCRTEGLQLVVAHMNYQKRDTANRDMELVRSYCAHFHIPFEARLQTKPCVGNFQAFAREERYRMYQELLKQYDASAVLLAHHLDDHLETYLMAKERGSMKEYLGIQEEAFIMGCRIIRPLMAYSKRELEAYCRENAVPF
ncbi:MAG: tRNA lysidine(34) synthetase TilS, partial [Clostridium sp.]|nr:tRNA lysidine(34) synthetase TilS [Clostridium sp.]